MNPSYSRQHGFSLVELMVAMMIALIALLAGSTMYLTTKQTNRIQQMQDALTQDGRFVMHMFQQVVSQAGFRDNPGLALGNDYLVPNSATSVTVGFTGDSISGVECDGSMSNGNKRLTIALNGTSLQCSAQGGAAVNWIAPSGGNGTEVASFRLQYGTDTGPNPTAASIGCGNTITPTTRPRDCVPDTYDLAVAQANQTQIMAVKACLVLRTERTDTSLAKPVIKDCSGNDIAGSASDNRLYRTFRTTVLLRNR